MFTPKRPQACLSAYQVHFTGVLHVLVHLLDGLIMLGLVGGCVCDCVTVCVLKT